MKTIEKKLFIRLPYQFWSNKSMTAMSLLTFDIETTGFSPDVSSIYLIGCCYYLDGSWKFIQFFADDYISEKEMLLQFIALAKTCTAMIHFNGLGFDIPYMNKKFAQYGISFDFQSYLQIDLYKKVYPYKHILQLENLKLKTLEQFIGINREDQYSGGDLVHVYVEYMKEKFGHNPDCYKKENTLLLHNEEDVLHLVDLCSILSYCDLFETTHTVVSAKIEEGQFTLELALEHAIPKPITLEYQTCSLFANEHTCTLKISILYDELKYFYPNYKEYYYLPAEDTAIHKSVAEFVDKSHRQKAKASNCYTRRTGYFIASCFLTGFPLFYRNYKDKTSYIEITESFLQDTEQLSCYASGFMKYLLEYTKKLPVT